MMLSTCDPFPRLRRGILAAQNAELYEALMAELKQRTSGRWHWDQIDYSWTGKDANLDWHSYQDLHVDFIDGAKVRATVHTGKTVCRAEDHEEATDKIQEVVCGCGYLGESSGDDWFLTSEPQIDVSTVLDPETSKLNAEATVDALYGVAQQALEPWDREIKLLDEICDEIYKRYNQE
jgi:hypothetical protein